MNWRRAIRNTLSVAGISFVVGSWIAADDLIAPAPSKVAWPAGLAFTPEDVNFSATDGIHLKGWFLPELNSTRAVVLLHGVHSNRIAMLSHALWLHTLGYNVFLYDARGCGESAPVARSFGYYETRDLMGALLWLHGQGMTRIACIGCSQGASTILLTSIQLPPSVRAVVAECPYATLRDTTDDHFRLYTGLPSSYFGVVTVPAAEWALGLNMDNVSPVREISQLKAPVYLIGGTADVLAPVAGLQKLYEAASSEKVLWLIPGAGHGDSFSYAEIEYKMRIGDFLRKYL